MSAAELEAMMVSASYRRLFVSVTSTRLFDAAADSGMVTVSAEAGENARADSQPQHAATGLEWSFRADLEPGPQVSHCVLAVNRTRFLGQPEPIGEAVVPLDSLIDQRAHVLTLSLAPRDHPHDVVGELSATLLFADYNQLRRAVIAAGGWDRHAEESGFFDPRPRTSISGVSSSMGRGGLGDRGTRRNSMIAALVQDGYDMRDAMRASDASSTTTSSYKPSSALAAAPPPALHMTQSAARSTSTPSVSSDWPSRGGGAAYERPRSRSPPPARTIPGLAAAAQEETIAAEISASPDEEGGVLAGQVLGGGIGTGSLHRSPPLTRVLTNPADGELGFLYEQDRDALKDALAAERAELISVRTESAGARLGRNILRSIVRRLVEKRRAMNIELRQMEEERAVLQVQLSLLRSGGGPQNEEQEVSTGPLGQSLMLLDEAESRHAQLLASRRRDHLNVVGSLQKEYLNALSSIRKTGTAPNPTIPALGGGGGGGGEEGGGEVTASATGASPVDAGTAPDRRTRFADGESGHDVLSSALSAAANTEPLAPPATGVGGGPYASTPTEYLKREASLQKQLFILEQQIQTLKEALMQRDEGLSGAERTLLQLRGAVAAADDGRVEAEKRLREAQAVAESATATLSAVQAELEQLRENARLTGGAESAWVAERTKLHDALRTLDEQRVNDAKAIHAEHEATIRDLEERLAFETASREYDRKEAAQLGAALKTLRQQMLMQQQQGGGGGAFQEEDGGTGREQPSTSLALSSKRKGKKAAGSSVDPSPPPSDANRGKGKAKTATVKLPPSKEVGSSSASSVTSNAPATAPPKAGAKKGSVKASPLGK